MMLGRPATEISIASILLAVSGLRRGPIVPAAEIRQAPIEENARRIADDFFQGLDRRAMAYLDTISLKDLIDNDLPATAF